MTNSKIETKMTLDQKELLRGFQKQNEAILRSMDSLNKLAKRGRGAGAGIGGGIDTALSSLKTFVGAVTGIGSIVGGIVAIATQLRREYDNLLERQKTAADKRISFQMNLTEALYNAGGFLGAEEIEESVTTIARDEDADQNKVAKVVSSALSARGPTSREQAEEVFGATRASLKIAPQLDEEQTAMLAGGAIDISKRFGISPEAAIGTIQNIGSLSRVTTLGKQVENLVPAINNLTQFGKGDPASGDKFKYAAAFVSQVSQGLGDVTGEVSTTAATRVFEGLEERFPGLTIKEAVEKIQNDDALRKKVIEGGDFGGKTFGELSFGKGKAKGFVRSMLTAGTPAAQGLVDAEQALGDFDAGLKKYNDRVTEVAKLLGTFRLDRIFKTAADALSIADEQGATASVIREGVTNMLKAAGISLTGQQIERLKNEIKTGGAPGVEQAIATLSDFENEFRNPTKNEVKVDDDWIEITKVSREQTDQEKRNADTFALAIEKMKQWAQQERARSAEQQKQQKQPPGEVKVDGARAAGGPVQAGRTFLVGEEGPELFMPKENGTIVNHDDLNRLRVDGARATGGPVHSGRKYLVGEQGEELFVSNREFQEKRSELRQFAVNRLREFFERSQTTKAVSGSIDLPYFRGNVPAAGNRPPGHEIGPAGHASEPPGHIPGTARPSSDTRLGDALNRLIVAVNAATTAITEASDQQQNPRNEKPMRVEVVNAGITPRTPGRPASAGLSRTR